jgi:hypothetical protein
MTGAIGSVLMGLVLELSGPTSGITYLSGDKIQR